ncbi:MAG: DUF2236 domain-containing protein [Salinibacterium sp.]|nr:MAG: DUF2236 domain-containing protein [Salinibacterium sp.]
MPLRIADVSADAVLLLGGARAILLQLANPAVGHGVAEHSDFANRPLDRLRATLTYLYVIVFGTAEEAQRVVLGVHAAHASVHSAPGATPSYDARDHHLQLWVAATLYDTAMHMRQLVYGPLSDTDAEALLADYAVVGVTLGVPVALWPANRVAFAEYWRRCESELRVDDLTRRVGQTLLHPTTGPFWLRALMPTVRLVTAGLLSPELRQAYDLRHDQRRFDRLVRRLAAIYPRLPRVITHAPQRHYLRVFRSTAH